MVGLISGDFSPSFFDPCPLYGQSFPFVAQIILFAVMPSEAIAAVSRLATKLLIAEISCQQMAMLALDKPVICDDVAD